MRSSFNYTDSSMKRQVAPAVKLACIFGGAVTQLGWVFFGFGMIGVWIFACHADFLGWYHFRGDLQTVQGTVVGNEETLFSVGGSDSSPGIPVYANHFTFTVNGQELQDVSYATGKSLAAGTGVTIEFSANTPTRARIKGMRSEVMGPFAGLVIIFPLVGILLVAITIPARRRTLHLVKNGEITTGKFKSKALTTMQINKQFVYKYTFEFQASDGRSYLATGKTHRQHILEDEAEERVLYDPANPTIATMVDSLPGRPLFDQRGNVSCGAAAFLYGLVPATSVVGHGYWLMTKVG